MRARASARWVARRRQIIDDLRRVDEDSDVRGTRAEARAGLRRDRRDAELRFALAEHYRSMGLGSQAARWGITIEGWATPAEVAELRRWILGFADDGDFVREWLMLDSDQDVPVALEDLVEPSLRRPRAEPPPAADGCLWYLATVIATIVATLCGVILMVKAINADPDLSSSAQLLRAIGGPAGLVAIIGFLVARRRERRMATRLAQYRPDVRPDPLYASDLAWRLRERGHRREAEILLRARVRNARDREARRALVAWAREVGRSDQAGRWAFPLRGEATVQERRAFAASILPVEPKRRLSRMRDLSQDWDLTSHDLGDLLRTGDVRDADAPPGDGGSDSETVEPERREFPFAWWSAAIGVAVIGCIVTAVLALHSESDAITAARWTVTAAGAAVGVVMIIASSWQRPGLRVLGSVVGLGLVALSGWLAWMLVSGTWG